MTLNFARLREAVTLWFDHRGQMHVCTRQSVHITRSSARTNNDGGAKRGPRVPPQHVCNAGSKRVPLPHCDNARRAENHKIRATPCSCARHREERGVEGSYKAAACDDERYLNRLN